MSVSPTSMQWWERRRLRYNLFVGASLVLGWLAYVAVVISFADIVGAPLVDQDGKVLESGVELGGVAALFQCCGAVMGLLVANLFYFLGAGVERLVPSAWVDTYRKWAWRAGVAFSCFLPFSIALLHLVLCLFFPDWYDPPTQD